MAERRMFAKAIIGSARFLRMPATSRLLYYDLGMDADDDGCVEAFSVMRKTGANDDDLRVLVSKGFVRILNEDLVSHILDWKVNNQIRKDRYAMGKITEKRFEMLSADYEKEQAELEEIIAADIAELEVFTTDKDRAQQFLSIAKRYTDFSQLTTPMVNEFVDKILVHAPEKIDGERTMEIEIYLKFIGKFDIPMPEPTPEELAAEEKARKKRAAERAKYERRKERKRQQKLEAERQVQAAENPYAPEEQTA